MRPGVKSKENHKRILTVAGGSRKSVCALSIASSHFADWTPTLYLSTSAQRRIDGLENGA
jgi:hypothetical protein